jgi:hypothetical protein
VRHLLAVQAQDRRSALLALRARIPDLADPGGDDGTLVVTWLMRGTLHLVHADDLPWLHALTAPTRMAANARRLRQLGVSAEEAEAALSTIRAALPFARADAPAVLGRRGQAVPHLLMLASLRGLCVQSPGGEVRAVTLPAVDRDAALAELARRHAVAHPGATDADLAAWSGLPLRDVRRGIAAAGHPAALAEPTAAEGAEPVPPRLLPPFDPYLLGWRDRGFAVPDALAPRVFPGGGMFRATATVDGEVVGTWTAPGGRVALDVDDPAPFAAEVADVERALALS